MHTTESEPALLVEAQQVLHDGGGLQRRVLQEDLLQAAHGDARLLDVRQQEALQRAGRLLVLSLSGGGIKRLLGGCVGGSTVAEFGEDITKTEICEIMRFTMDCSPIYFQTSETSLYILT